MLKKMWKNPQKEGKSRNLKKRMISRWQMRITLGLMCLRHWKQNFLSREWKHGPILCMRRFEPFNPKFPGTPLVPSGRKRVRTLHHWWTRVASRIFHETYHCHETNEPENWRPWYRRVDQYGPEPNKAEKPCQVISCFVSFMENRWQLQHQKMNLCLCQEYCHCFSSKGCYAPRDIRTSRCSDMDSYDSYSIRSKVSQPEWTRKGCDPETTQKPWSSDRRGNLRDTCQSPELYNIFQPVHEITFAPVVQNELGPKRPHQVTWKTHLNLMKRYP